MVASEGMSTLAFISVATSLGSHANVTLVDEGDGDAAAAGSGTVGAPDGVGGGDAEWATARRQERINNMDIWARSGRGSGCVARR